MEAGGLAASNPEHESADVTQTGGKADDHDGQHDQQTEVLLAVLNSHLDEEPDD